MSRKKVVFSLLVSVFLSMFYVNAVFANGFLTLPFEGEFNVTATFCSYKFKNGKCHGGTDYATPIGTLVVSMYDGTVIKSPDDDVPTNPDVTSYGNYIKIDHGTINGKKYETIYSHLLTGTFLVKTGDKVIRGQTLAKTGNSGTSTGPHLHFEVRENGIPVDPYDANNWLWTTNPPEHGYCYFFDLSKDIPQGFKCGYDTEFVQSSEIGVWQVHVTGPNPGIESPEITKLKAKNVVISFRAKILGKRSSSPGYIYLRDEYGNWDHRVELGATDNKEEFKEYVVDLGWADNSDTLIFDKFSIELTQGGNGANEYWLFNWVKIGLKNANGGSGDSGSVGGGGESGAGTGSGGNFLPEDRLPKNIRVVNVYDRGAVIKWEDTGADRYGIQLYDYDSLCTFGILIVDRFLSK